jgi:DNA ligase (NAD+)
MSTEMKMLLEELKNANAAYRAGKPVMSDEDYDAKIEQYRQFDPANEFLNEVESEPENTFGGVKVIHDERMLSMAKVYSIPKLRAFFKSIDAAAQECGVPQPVMYTVQAKLDGISGNRSRRTGTLATRGTHGIEGEDVTVAIERGVVLDSADPYGFGELVVNREYFENELAFDEELNPDGFKSPRSFMAGVLGADAIKAKHVKTLEAKMARMVFYKDLPEVLMDAERIINDIDALQDIRVNCPYDTDGIVISAVDPRIRDYMGATHHHHRFQVAFKQKGVMADTTVTSITKQTGRTGHVTPVAHFNPVLLPGALVRKATVHNYTILKERGIGVGARLTIIRSGEVIPKIEAVITRSDNLDIPTHCPSCGEELIEDGAFLTCIGQSCPAQLSARLYHFFHTINIAKGFGDSAVDKLVEANILSVPKILTMTATDFEDAGFGSGQAANLKDGIDTLKNTPIVPWLFLGALGIHHMGKGSSQTLLDNFGTVDKLRSASVNDIMAISGFGDKTAPYIHAALQRRSSEIDALLEVLTLKEAQTQLKGHSLDGMLLVFTGTMTEGRNAMETLARDYGANIGSSVSKKTTALVTGTDVGATKIGKAEKMGVAVWSEAEFRAKLR